jgi:hypothetical protein
VLALGGVLRSFGDAGGTFMMCGNKSKKKKNPWRPGALRGLQHPSLGGACPGNVSAVTLLVLLACEKLSDIEPIDPCLEAVRKQWKLRQAQQALSFMQAEMDTSFTGCSVSAVACSEQLGNLSTDALRVQGFLRGVLENRGVAASSQAGQRCSARQASNSKQQEEPCDEQESVIQQLEALASQLGHLQDLVSTVLQGVLCGSAAGGQQDVAARRLSKKMAQADVASNARAAFSTAATLLQAFRGFVQDPVDIAASQAVTPLVQGFTSLVQVAADALKLDRHYTPGEQVQLSPAFCRQSTSCSSTR